MMTTIALEPRHVAL